MITIAMHGARPTMMMPVRYSGRSGRNAHARVNISAGPMTHTRNSAASSILRSRVTVSSRS